MQNVKTIKSEIEKKRIKLGKLQCASKTWWAPVWRGLVSDSQGTHYRRMKTALWLFIYLIIHADRKSGMLVRKSQTISVDMGISLKTIRRWLTILKDQEYICVTTNGRCLSIRILRWKGTSEYPNMSTQSAQIWAGRLPKFEESQSPVNDRIMADSSLKSQAPQTPKDNKIKKEC